MIGWYAHHHGRGHLHRAASVLGRLDARATVLTSATVPDGLLPDGTAVLTLPRDDTGEGFRDPAAGGALHWAPLDHRGYRDRMAGLASWLHDADAAALVVDVSVEVTALARLLGVPTVAVAMPGDRADPPHVLAHTAATALVAAWPAWAPLAPHLGAHAARLHRVGGISRFEGRPTAPGEPDPAGRPRVVVLGGAGGDVARDGYWRAVAAALPDVTLTVLGGSEGVWVDDPWPLLCDADLVLTHAGQNAVADVAAAGAPAVVLPAPRPFDEQLATARILGAAGLATVLESPPAPDAWTALLPALLRSADRARARDRWREWGVDGAAARAADVVAAVAVGEDP